MLFATVNLPDTKMSTRIAVADDIDSEVQAQSGLYMMYLDPESGLPQGDHFKQIAGVRTADSGNEYAQAFRQISDVDFEPTGKGTYRIAVSTRMVRSGTTLIEGGVYVSENISSDLETNAPFADFTLLRNHPDAGGVALGSGGSVYAAFGHYGRGWQFLVPDLSGESEDVADLIPSDVRFRDKYNEKDLGQAKEGYQPGIYLFLSDGAEWNEAKARRMDMAERMFRPSFLRVLDVKDGILTLHHLYIGTHSVGGFRTLVGVSFD